MLLQRTLGQPPCFLYPSSPISPFRNRLNRGGDRQANSALWHVVITRLASDPNTQAYMERRVKEGRSKREAIRVLKRYVARAVYRALPRG